MSKLLQHKQFTIDSSPFHNVNRLLSGLFNIDSHGECRARGTYSLPLLRASQHLYLQEACTTNFLILSLFYGAKINKTVLWIILIWRILLLFEYIEAITCGKLLIV